MILLAVMLVAGADIRTAAISLLDEGRPAQAEVLLLQDPQARTSCRDLLLAARLDRGDVAGAAVLLPQVLSDLQAGSVPPGPLARHLHGARGMVFSLAPWIPDGVDRETVLRELEGPIEGARTADSVRGALRSIMSGQLDPAARRAPTTWRDAALALAGDDDERTAARARLARAQAPPVEMAWRLHVIGRSHLLEEEAGQQRRGMVHLARIAAIPDLRSAHPRLALHALDVLIQRAPEDARGRLLLDREDLLRALRTELENTR